MPTGVGLPAETIREPTNHVGADVLICPAERSSAILVMFWSRSKNRRASLNRADEDICPYASSLSYHLQHGRPARALPNPGVRRRASPGGRSRCAATSPRQGTGGTARERRTGAGRAGTGRPQLSTLPPRHARRVCGAGCRSYPIARHARSDRRNQGRGAKGRCPHPAAGSGCGHHDGRARACRAPMRS